MYNVPRLLWRNWLIKLLKLYLVCVIFNLSHYCHVTLCKYMYLHKKCRKTFLKRNDCCDIENWKTSNAKEIQIKISDIIQHKRALWKTNLHLHCHQRHRHRRLRGVNGNDTSSTVLVTVLINGLAWRSV